MMRLWYEKHMRYLYDLSEFEGDDIEEFAGWNINDDEEDDGEEAALRGSDDMTWLFPEKGPGKFKDLAQKKKKKKKKGKKKKGKKKASGLKKDELWHYIERDFDG